MHQLLGNGRTPSFGRRYAVFAAALLAALATGPSARAQLIFNLNFMDSTMSSVDRSRRPRT